MIFDTPYHFNITLRNKDRIATVPATDHITITIESPEALSSPNPCIYIDVQPVGFDSYEMDDLTSFIYQDTLNTTNIDLAVPYSDLYACPLTMTRGT